MKRAAAAFLSAADSALRPCALTQNNHATIFVPVAKNEGKLAMVVIMRKRRGMNSSAILQFLQIMALECGQNVFICEKKKIYMRRIHSLPMLFLTKALPFNSNDKCLYMHSYIHTTRMWTLVHVEAK